LDLHDVVGQRVFVDQLALERLVVARGLVRFGARLGRRVLAHVALGAFAVARGAGRAHAARLFACFDLNPRAASVGLGWFGLFVRHVSPLSGQGVGHLG
jgi:hypothetical protein